MNLEPTQQSTPASVSDQDLALLARVVDGDERAFEALYRRYHPRLLRFVYRMIQRTDLLEEVVNDTLYVVWKGAVSFAGKSRVSTWILGIAYRKGLKARSRSGSDSGPESQEILEQLPAPDEAVSTDDRDRLERALAQLSMEQRMVVELTYYFGYSYGEIAAITHCPVGTVKTRMFHARKVLRRLLPDLADGQPGDHARSTDENTSI